MRGGHDANGTGDFTRARQCFLDAYASSPTAVARISAANMSLKLGQRERAAAEYEIILRDEALTDENRAVRQEPPPPSLSRPWGGAGAVVGRFGGSRRGACLRPRRR